MRTTATLEHTDRHRNVAIGEIEDWPKNLTVKLKAGVLNIYIENLDNIRCAARLNVVLLIGSANAK